MIRRKPKVRMGVREPDRIDCKAHLQWIRGCVCVMFSSECSGPIEAAHIRNGTDGGTGLKPSDRYVVPLCRHHHAMQHAVGEKTFWAGHDPLKIAARYWKESAARVKWERKKERT